MSVDVLRMNDYMDQEEQQQKMITSLMFKAQAIPLKPKRQGKIISHSMELYYRGELEREKQATRFNEVSIAEAIVSSKHYSDFQNK